MAEMMSIGIVGTGWVGSSVAISTLHNAAAHDVVLHDRNAALAEGETMDLSHGLTGPGRCLRPPGRGPVLSRDRVIRRVGEVIAPDIDDTELAALGHSAEVLHKAIAAVAREQ